jgi:hypothetical protein
MGRDRQGAVNLTPHMTFAAGYGHCRTVANHTANGVWGITTKWDFRVFTERVGNIASTSGTGCSKQACSALRTRQNLSP